MKRAIVLATALALSFPIHLGEAVATDAAVYITTLKPRPTPVPTTDVRGYIQQRASRSGWRGRQWRCLEAILYRESRFNPKADNGTHYGVFQERHLPPGTDLVTQTRRGLRYVHERYGTPCEALAHHNRKGWY